MVKQTKLHKCNKEAEIATILEKISTIADDMHEMKKHIAGNGRPGLLERTSNLETANKVMYGILALTISALAVLVVIF